MTRFTGNRPKYGNKKKIDHRGYTFDSKLEAALFDLLTIMQTAGEISELHHHPGTVFLSDARIQYRPDFKYIDNASGEESYAEAKGFSDQKWPLKKKLWKSYGPGKLTIYGGSYRSLIILETIIPKCLKEAA